MMLEYNWKIPMNHPFDTVLVASGQSLLLKFLLLLCLCSTIHMMTVCDISGTENINTQLVHILCRLCFWHLVEQSINHRNRLGNYVPMLSSGAAAALAALVCFRFLCVYRFNMHACSSWGG